MKINIIFLLAISGLLWGCGRGEQTAQPKVVSSPKSTIQVTLEQRIKACSICHGNESVALSNIFPNISGLSKEYLLTQLLDYKSGKRQEFIMNAMVREHSDDELDKLAKYYSEQEKPSTKPSADREAIALGKKIYHQSASKDAASCESCHGARGEGKVMGAIVVPALAGQKAAYLKMQLNHYKYKIRDNDPDGIMRNAVANIRDTELLAVAEYVTTLK